MNPDKIDMMSMCYMKLMAEYFDLIYPPVNGKELDFWLKHAQAANGPTMELGCGTGRVLVPLSEHGIDVTGIDCSESMLDRCRAKFHGKPPLLIHDYIKNAELDRRFGLIYMPCGGLDMYTSDDEIRTAFVKAMEHLNPGGTFIIEVEPVHLAKDLEKQNYNWYGGWVQGDDGVLFAKRQVILYDPETHIRETTLILEKFVNGRLVGTEANLGKMRFHDPETAIPLLEEAGFVDIEATDWLSSDAPTGKSKVVTVKCLKPE